MTFVDEKIATLEKARRQLRKEEESEKGMQEESQESAFTLEQAEAQIQEGKLMLGQKELLFEKQMYFEDKLPLLIIKDFFDEVKIDDKTLVFTNNTENICIISTYLSEDLPEKSLEVRQKEMEENFLKMQMYVEIKKVVHLKFLEYIVYRTPTGKGWIYNIIYWLLKDERRIVGNVNCLDKQSKTYGVVLEALVREINTLLE